jgi:hypothetical protein
MAALLQVSPERCRLESAAAAAAEAAERGWRRSWRRLYAQCLGLAALGYAGYGQSWGLDGDAAVMLASASFVVAYVLPLFRLLVFLLHHADQF